VPASVDSAAADEARASNMLGPPRGAPVRLLLALAAGLLLPAAFAPLGCWPLAVLSPAVLMWLWQDCAPREAARLGFWFNFATFALGTYWLYISIHGFGRAPVWLALLLMLGLVGIMGLYHAALGYATARWLPRRGLRRWLLALPAAWLLIEWWRGWFLSGFSWLSLGYSQTDSWLAGFAPLAGVYGVSAVLLVCAGALTALALGTRGERIAALATLLILWAAGGVLWQRSWTYPSGAAVSIAVVQGAMPPDEKWQERNQAATLALYRRLTEQVLGTQLIVWPESAPADLANDIVPYLDQLYREAHAHGSALVLGVLRADGDPEHPEELRYYNSVLSLDNGLAWYDKRHLVPFAEFFPVPQFMRTWLRLMSLPYADFTRGGPHQPPLPAAHLLLGTTVCYEDAYGSYMLSVLPRADALVNVTNDAWFGHSSARYQHFQIARMRALEGGRYLVRAANDGLSGVIGPKGAVVATAPEFRALTLVSKIVPYAGTTPYVRVGNYLVVSLAVLALAYGLLVGNDRPWRRRGTRGERREVSS
jgi:apolipoprotein N-acyltransferase